MDAQPVNRRFFLKQVGLIAPGVFVLPRLTMADDEKLVKQLGKLDVELVKALTELAKKYDKDGVPEAAHFFASCAVGFGSKDESLVAIKGINEASVFLGKLRGGDTLKETVPITGALGSIATAYRKALDPLIVRARKGELPEDTRKMMLEAGVKSEIARGAHEYVQAVQRFNSLRKAIGLRAVLWQFDKSRELILVCWYTCETEDWQYKDLKKDSPFFTSYVEDRNFGSGGPLKLSELPEGLKSYALARQQILNPNARTLRLAHWENGSQIDYFSLYGIPQLPYRDDIPTPTQRFRTETLVKDWVDVEETVQVAGKKVPFVRYPYPSEQDAPSVYSNGKGASEEGWADSEHSFRDRAGVPIMVRFYTEAKLTDVNVELADKAGVSQPCRVYLSGDKRVNLEANSATILVLPNAPLRGSTQYSINIKCMLDEERIDKKWSFTTRPK